MGNKPIRVLIVDDSLLVRKILSEGLSADHGIEVVGTAPDPYIARDKIIEFRPDVMTLDIELPRMDGVEFLRRLMPQHPMPVVMVSVLTHKGKRITLEALECGAVDFVAKPTSNLQQGLENMMLELRTKIKIAAKANVSSWKQRKQILPSKTGVLAHTPLAQSANKVIAIGASTGGTEAIKTIISRFPPSTPGIVIVQHMPPGFTAMFAERLNNSCSMEVKEACSGDSVQPGRVLIAPGDRHISLVRSNGSYSVKCRPGPKVCGHCPSVEVLMNSVADLAGPDAVGVILTGMGADGAGAMLRMRQGGARTIAQDRDSCVVFGMPYQAYERGGVERLVPLDDIAEEIIRLISS